MAKKTIKAQMKQRRDTKANWAATNPVLLDGELGIVSDDPNLYKVGDGATAWNDLPFRGFDGTLAQELGTSPNAVISQKAVTEKLTELESKVSKESTLQNKYLKGVPNAKVYKTNSDNSVTDYANAERNGLINRFNSYIESVETINFDGVLSIVRFELHYYAKMLLIKLYPHTASTDDVEDVAENKMISMQFSLNEIITNNYIITGNVLYSNIGVRIKLRKSIYEALNSLSSNQTYTYDATELPINYSVDGFKPTDATSKLFNNSYPNWTVFRDHKYLWAANDLLQDIVIDGGYMASVDILTISDASINLQLRVAPSDQGDVISAGDGYDVVITSDRNAIMEWHELGRVKLLLNKTISLLSFSLGSQGSAYGKKANYLASNDYTQLPTSPIINNGYVDKVGVFQTDSSHYTYTFPINNDSVDCIVAFRELDDNTRIGLCNENGTINKWITEYSAYTKFSCKGYYYIIVSSKGYLRSVEVSGYDKVKALRGLSSLKCVKGGEVLNVGNLSVVKAEDGEYRTSCEKAIGNISQIKTEIVSASFTHPKTNRVYSDNCLMEICKDGTKFYYATKADGQADDYYHPIMWMEKNGEKSLFLDTDSDTPEGAIISGGADLTGINWLTRTGNTLYGFFNSITETEDGGLLVSLYGQKNFDGELRGFCVIFKVNKERTLWTPKIITSNESYNGKPTAFGFPTKNNSIHKFYAYGRNCIVISEYGNGTPQYWKEQGVEKNGNGIVGKVWLSMDNGNNWKKIFDMDEKINGIASDISDSNFKWSKSYAGRMSTHLHCCYPDMVNEILWITNGDAGTTDGRNTLFYISLSELVNWYSNYGEYVDATNMNPIYTDNEPLPNFNQYILTEQGRDVSIYANAVTTFANFQMYCLFSINNMLLLGNDTSRQIIYGINNVNILRDGKPSNNMFIDILYEIDKNNPQTSIKGFPQAFYRKDENSPIICLYAGVGILMSYDGVVWKNFGNKDAIRFASYMVKDTDGKYILVEHQSLYGFTNTKIDW